MSGRFAMALYQGTTLQAAQKITSDAFRGCSVSGHDFSRADERKNDEGF